MFMNKLQSLTKHKHTFSNLISNKIVTIEVTDPVCNNDFVSNKEMKPFKCLQRMDEKLIIDSKEHSFLQGWTPSPLF